ncbi:MAG: DUF1800 domain-containing protein [Acidobacteriaceae bacterium]|nr:DUF1800 domain-containing protein [Acidobacteriaceae bacterium]
MLTTFSKRSLLREASKAAVCALLTVTLTVPEAIAADLPKPGAASKIPTENATVLHTLNRFTFGPRPGDEKAAMALGLNAWFERQLHPETIDDSAFEQRLAAYPALKLSQTELIERFPSPLRVRFYLRNNAKPPKTHDPVLNAVYADYFARYRFGLRVAAQGGKQGNVSPAKIAEEYDKENAGAASMGTADTADGMKPEMAKGKRGGRKAGLEVAANEPLPPSTMTAGEAQSIVALAPTERFERIVALSPGDHLRFVGFTANRVQEVLVGFTPEQREAFGAMVNPIQVVSNEVMESRVLRDVYSERQLQAVMTDFWLNHFSVYIRKNQNEPYLLNSYQRDVILPNSLGSFERLLIATAESPAMLTYLDNFVSVGPNSRAAERARRAKEMRPDGPLAKRAPEGLNENYARELMELHTVGVDGGYTQKDVIEVAKCFSGWTLSRPYGAGGEDGDGIQTFKFDPARHEGGSKTVMGVTIPEGGMQEGLTVLHMLATSPKTAHFISQKLAVRFVADNPPAALVDRMAATFTRTHGNISAVLSTMYHSPEFWAPEAYRAKVKTPLEFMASALRASDAQVKNAGVLVQAVARLGMPVYGMQTPQGYSWKSEDWVSSGALVNRMNFALVLAGDHIRGITTDWGQLAENEKDEAPTPVTEKRLEQIVLGRDAQAHTRSTVLEQFQNPEVSTEAQKGFAMAGRSADEDSPDEGMQAQMGAQMGPKMRARRVAGDGSKKGGGNGFSFQAGPPSTPLETMAGLLLGSPDFQRR